MAIDITISINKPVIHSNPTYPYFSTRYRLKGTGVWFPDVTPRDNTPYIYSFPSTGIWEIEITLINSATESCDPIIYEVNVREGCNCVSEVSAAIVYNAAPAPGVYSAHIHYTLPGTEPPCGWIVKLTGNGIADLILNFQNLPAGGDLYIVNSNIQQYTQVQIIANCCDENLGTVTATFG